MSRVLQFVLFLTLVWAVVAKNEMHKGSRVYRVTVSGDAAEAAWLEYEAREELDVWEHARGGHGGVVLVTPRQLASFLDLIRAHHIQHELLIADLYEFLVEEEAERARHRAAAALRAPHDRVLPFDDYPRYEEVDEYMVRVAAEYPDLVTLVSAGPSFQGRDIKYLKISTTNFEDASKPVIYIDAMIHAREWVTTPSALLAIQSLVVNRTAEDQDLLDRMDWIVLPLVNPDGYEYSHTHDRVWRKTMSTNHPGGQECPGVDGNRNFAWEFDTLGVSDDPCSLVYPGQAAASEPEVSYVTAILHEHLHRLAMYIAIHSQGNWVLFGYGDRSIPQDALRLHLVAAAMGSAMDARKLPAANYYVAGNSAELLYETSGTASDYASALGVPFAYTYELPGYGYGHQVPVQHMEHVAAETWAGIQVGARLATLYYHARAAAPAAPAAAD